MSTELKIKAKSLAAEAHIIRAEERKAKKCGDTVQVHLLRCHRTEHVRKAARSTHLARAFIRGLAYKQVEQTCHTQPNRDEVRRLLGRYGLSDFLSQNSEERITTLNCWFDAK